VADVADDLSRFDIDSLKIQEEEVLTLLSGSENNNISNIKWTIPMHTALIFKEQAILKEPGLKEKGLAQPHYSIQHIEGYDLLSYKKTQLLRQENSTWFKYFNPCVLFVKHVISVLGSMAHTSHLWTNIHHHQICII
jgi:hypothetical protein